MPMEKSVQSNRVSEGWTITDFKSVIFQFMTFSLY